MTSPRGCREAGPPLPLQEEDGWPSPLHFRLSWETAGTRRKEVGEQDARQHRAGAAVFLANFLAPRSQPASPLPGGLKRARDS